MLAIGYKKRSGKDTVADYLVQHYGYDKFAFADNLKLATRAIYGLPIDAFINKDEKDGYWPYTKRDMLKLVGEGLRAVNPNIWIESLEGTLRMCCPPYLDPKIVISDLRRKNEFEYCQQKGMKMVLIEPSFPGYPIDRYDNHITETELDDFPRSKWDFIIQNNSTLDNLYIQINEMINEINNRTEQKL